MGSCCTNQLLDKIQNIETTKLELWYLGNDLFDTIAFNRSIQQDENHSFQRYLRQTWKHKTLSLSIPKTNPEALFNQENFADIHYLILK